MLLAELLLVLAGHASSLFPVVYTQADEGHDEGDAVSKHSSWLWTMQLSSSTEGLHPGERAHLDSLAALAAKHRRAKLFATQMRERIRHETLKAASSKSREEEHQDTSSHHDGTMSALVASLLKILYGFQQQVLETEADILQQNWDMVSFEDVTKADPSRRTKSPFVSLANIRSRFYEWEIPLAALDALVTTLLRGPDASSSRASDVLLQEAAQHTQIHPPPLPDCPVWPAGRLLDLLSNLTRTAVGPLETHYSMLLESIEDALRPALVSWLCHGEPRDARDVRSAVQSIAIVQRHMIDRSSGFEQSSVGTNNEWNLDPNTLPSRIDQDEELKASMLYVGRALSRINAHAAQRRGSLSAADTEAVSPQEISERYATLLQSRSGRLCSNPHEFKRIVLALRHDIAEWIWSNLLTPDIVEDIFRLLGDIFLCRDGLFLVALLERLKQMQRDKLRVTHTSTTAGLHVSDLDWAFRNANEDVGLDETDRLQHITYGLPDTTMQDSISPQKSFADLTIGTPFEVRFRPPFPIDFILLNAELQSYTSIFSFLLAVNGTRQRMRDTWVALSKTQKARRRFTGTREGGSSKKEEAARATLLRRAHGFIQSSTWLLDVLIGHFQVDVIDAQYTSLLAQLQFREKQSHDSDGQGSYDSAPCNLAHDEDTTARPPSILSTSSRARLSTPASKYRSAAPSPDIGSNKQIGCGTRSTQTNVSRDGLDYAAIQATHSTFLAFLLDGLLLNDAAASKMMRAILQTAQQFAGQIEMWGGDVLPELLGGFVASQGEEGASFDPLQEAAERTKVVRDLQTSFDTQTQAFFAHLSTASTKGPIIAPLGVQKNAGTHHAAGYTAMNLAASRHHEQLLLRLDFNGILSLRTLATQS